MAEIDVRLKLEVSATITLNERECAALNALVGYGDDAFLKCFYKNMGEHYLKPHEAGLRSLFANVRSITPIATRAITEARAAIVKARPLKSKDAA